MKFSTALGVLIFFITLDLPSQNAIIGLSESGPSGSDYSGGMIWKCSADGIEFKSLKKFDDQSPGRKPTIVFQGSDGLIYGVLNEGGGTGLGIVFRMNPDGSNFQSIWDKSITKLFEGSDGYLYGIRDGIYRLKKDGSQYSKIASNQGGNTDLVEASNGKLYYGGSSHLEFHYINKDGSGPGTFTLPEEDAIGGGIRRWRVFVHTIDRIYVYRDFFSHISPGDPDPPNPYHFTEYILGFSGQIIQSKDGYGIFTYDYTAPVSEVLGIDHHLYKMNLKENTDDLTLTPIPDSGCEGSTLGRTLRFTDPSAHFYGEARQGDQWDLFSWRPADSSCTIIRHWDESMGYKGKPQGYMLITSGTTTIDHNMALRIFPNPNPGIFSVELPEAASADMTLRILNLAGQLLIEKQAKAGNPIQTLEAGDLAVGLYFLQVLADGKVLVTEKFVKQ